MAIKKYKDEVYVLDCVNRIDVDKISQNIIVDSGIIEKNISSITPDRLEARQIFTAEELKDKDYVLIYKDENIMAFKVINFTSVEIYG